MTRLTPILALLALALSACGPSLHTPGGFARVDGRHDLRVASPDGVAIAVNVYRNRRPRGDLEFWAGAVSARIRNLYGNAERSRIVSDAGVEGVQLRAHTIRNGRPHQYWAAVFVDGRHVVMVEAGGDDAYFGPQAEAIDAAIRSVEI